MIQRHTLVITYANHPGVLTRITSIFYRHHFDIDSLAAQQMSPQGLSKMVISFPGEEQNAQLLRRQIEKLIDVQSARFLDLPHVIDDFKAAAIAAPTPIELSHGLLSDAQGAPINPWPRRQP